MAKWSKAVENREVHLSMKSKAGYNFYFKFVLSSRLEILQFFMTKFRLATMKSLCSVIKL